MADGDIYCIECKCRMTTDGTALNVFYKPDEIIEAVRRGSIFTCPKCKKTVFSWCGAWMSDESQIKYHVKESTRKGDLMITETE
jgi:hypothetical protein